MKKLISVLLVLTLCLGLFAGCNNNKTPDTDSNLDAAKRILFNQYNTASKDEENKILADKELSTVVIVDGVSYSVEWKINMTSGDSAAVVIAESETPNSVTLDVVNQDAESHYDLVATIKDAEGNSVSLTLKCYTPAVQKIQLDDGKIVLTLGGKYVTGEDYLYTSSSGSTKHELAISENKDDALILTVRDNGDDTVTFVTDDGKFLMADGTNVQIVDAEDDNTKFVLEAAENGQYIKCANATYNGNAQYLEVYSGYLTCYGMSSSSDVSIYTFVMETVTTVSAKEVLDAAYALEAGLSLEGGPFTLTGEITKIDTAWSDDYQNITVTIKVDDDGRTIQCFRLQGTGAKDLKVGDNITVEGTISNFNGTVQFDKACTLKKNNSNVHVHTEEVIPAKDATCTEPGLTEGKKCSECGAILVEQKEIAAAHTWGEWTVTKEATGEEEGEETRTCSACGEKETRVIEKLTVVPAYVKDAPVIGKAYQFGLFHGNEKADVFFNGKNYEGKSGVMAWYLAYTANREGAADVFVEAVEGVENAYRLYFMNGEAKTYIRTYPRDGYEGQGTLELTTSVPSEYYTFSTDYHTLIYTDANGNQFYLGSSGTYTSISVSNISYIEAETSYVSHLYNPDAGATVEPDTDPVDPVDPVDPTESTTLTVVMADYAANNSWANGTLYAEAKLNDDITVITACEKPNAQYGQNTGKYYTSDSSWRVYQAEVASITVKAAEGKTIISVKITYLTKNNTDTILNGEEVIASETVVTVNGNSITFTVGNTGDKTNGQVRITGIEIVYG